MKALFPVFFLLLSLASLPSSSAASVFINELHYDNAGSDTNEGVEIAALAGTSLDGYHLLLYNGTNGAVYNNILLTGLIDDQQAGFGTLFFEIPSIQNGPDGLALINATGDVLQFISYEGSFIASNGEAKGMTSIDIGVFEAPDASVDTSLQLTGSGDNAGAFSWVLGTASRGAINDNQSFVSAVPLPATLPFLFFAVASLGLCRGGSGQAASAKPGS